MSSSPEPPRYAVVTLLTSDNYLPGALTTVNSLLDVEPDRTRFDTVCLTTPSTVGHNSLQALQKVFDVVVGVEPLVTESWEELKLLGALLSTRLPHPSRRSRSRGRRGQTVPPILLAIAPVPSLRY